MSLFARSRRYFRPDTGCVLVVFGLMVLATGVNALKPWPLAVLVDSVLGPQPVPAWLRHLVTAMPGTAAAGTAGLIGTLIVAILILHAAQAALAALYNDLAIGVGLRGLQRVRCELFDKLLRLSQRFSQQTPAGDLIQRTAWDSCAFQTLFQQGLVSTASASISLALLLGVLFRLDTLLALTLLGFVPVIGLTMAAFGRGMRTRAQGAQNADSRITSLVQQALVAIPLIQSCSREASEARRFADQVRDAAQRRRAQHRSEVLYNFSVSLVFGLAAAALTWLGARRVLASELSVGELLVFLAYLGQLHEPLNQLSHVGSTVSAASAGASRVLEILDASEDITDRPEAVDLASPGEIAVVDTSAAASPETRLPDPTLTTMTIDFERVSFNYRPSQPVLEEVSLRIEPRRTTALVGPSGAGKTTVLHLVMRFFDPDRGAVRVAGRDLRDFKLRSLRAGIAWVPQQPVLLPGTIAENIGYGRPEASREMIEAAARDAGADGFIGHLPAGYDTRVGEGAQRLSLGEAQRVNIACALLKNAPILLLDEPASALDPESERQVRAALRRLRGRCTVLVVTHRLPTIREADHVIVLGGGRVLESGAPKDLECSGGFYARMAAGQPGQGTLPN